MTALVVDLKDLCEQEEPIVVYRGASERGHVRMNQSRKAYLQYRVRCLAEERDAIGHLRTNKSFRTEILKDCVIGRIL